MYWDWSSVQTIISFGWLGYGSDGGSGFLAYNIGYPGDKPNATMWRSSCEVSSEDFAENDFTHVCDTWAGSSGSSMYRFVKQPENRIVQGINVAEVVEKNRNDSFNVGVRLNDAYFEWVRSLRQ